MQLSCCVRGILSLEVELCLLVRIVLSFLQCKLLVCFVSFNTLWRSESGEAICGSRVDEIGVRDPICGSCSRETLCFIYFCDGCLSVVYGEDYC